MNNKVTLLTGKNAVKNVIAMIEKTQGAHDDILGDMIIDSSGVVKWSNYDAIETTITSETKISTLSYDSTLPDIKVATIPTYASTITSYSSNNSYSFKINTENRISVDVLLSNWDSNGDYFAGVNANPNKPELTYFVNTDAFKDWGVPGDERYISKRSKAAYKVNYTYTSDPRVVIADNAVFNVHIPSNVDVDYFVMHCSGHNGATSAVEYVYGESDKIYIDRHDMVADNKGTTDITVYLRNKNIEDYKLFNGNIENNKKFWTSIDFYKYGDDMKRYGVHLPPVEIINKPINEAEVYEALTLSGYVVSTNVPALSGICLSENSSYLFGVSDTHGLYKINFDGKNEQLWASNDNLDLEGITIDGNGDLYACVENEQKIVKFSKANNFSSPEVVSIKDAYELLKVMLENNNGFEGIAWYKDDEFFIGNQFKPIVIVHYSLSKGILRTFELKWDDEKGGVTEIADLQYDKWNNCLWVIDSRTSHIFKYDLHGNTIQGYMTKLGAAPNTESFVIDFNNEKIYVGADNNDGSLWTFNTPFKFLTITATTEPIQNGPDINVDD